MDKSSQQTPSEPYEPRQNQDYKEQNQEDEVVVLNTGIDLINLLEGNLPYLLFRRK